MALSIAELRPRHAMLALAGSILLMLAWSAIVVGVTRRSPSEVAGMSSLVLSGLLVLFDLYVFIISVALLVARRRRSAESEGWIVAVFGSLVSAGIVAFVGLCVLLAAAGPW